MANRRPEPNIQSEHDIRTPMRVGPPKTRVLATYQGVPANVHSLRTQGGAWRIRLVPEEGVLTCPRPPTWL